MEIISRRSASLKTPAGTGVRGNSPSSAPIRNTALGAAGRERSAPPTETCIHSLGNKSDLLALHHQLKQLRPPSGRQMLLLQYQGHLIQNFHQHVPQTDLLLGKIPFSYIFQFVGHPPDILGRVQAF